MRPIYLASASPRRAELLRQIDVPFTILPPLNEEEHPPFPGDDVIEWAKKLAEAKAFSAAKRLPLQTSAYLLAADTIVLLPVENSSDNLPLWHATPVQLLGKPQNSSQALSMLSALSGKSHLVITAFTLLLLPEGNCFTSHSETEVKFRELAAEEINDYIASGEPFDKAGGYGIQGRGAVLVEQIIGDYYTVVGLPLAALWQALKKAENSNA